MEALLSQPTGPNTDRSPALYVVLWVLQPIALSLVAARLYVRIRRRQQGGDDWCILLSWILGLITDITVTVMLSKGGMRHILYMSLPVLQDVFTMQAWLFPFPAFAITFGKTGVALLLLRLLERASNRRRWFIIVNIALYWATTITTIGVIYGQCKPASALWSVELHLLGQTHCMDPLINQGVSLAQNILGAYLDFTFALLPITIFWNLSMPLGKRIACCVLLGLGVFAGVCASVKCAAVWRNRNSLDITWAAYELFLWTSLELHALLIAGCIPVAKPLFDRWAFGTPIVPSDLATAQAYRLGSVVVVKETTFGTVETRAADSGDEENMPYSTLPPWDGSQHSHSHSHRHRVE